VKNINDQLHCSYLILFIFYLEYVPYEDLNGEHENDLKTGEFRPLINYLKYLIPNDNRIRLNCEVTKVKFIKEDHQLLIQMNNLNEQREKTIICDHIIWTTSLGYLKNNFHRIFAEEANLIDQKQNAIANIGFGTINKVRLFLTTRTISNVPHISIVFKCRYLSDLFHFNLN